MGWMSKLRKQNPNRKQLLFFSQDELPPPSLAVVMIPWVSSFLLCAANDHVA